MERRIKRPERRRHIPDYYSASSTVTRRPNQRIGEHRHILLANDTTGTIIFGVVRRRNAAMRAVQRQAMIAQYTAAARRAGTVRRPMPEARLAATTMMAQTAPTRLAARL